jgi:integrase
MTSKKHQLDRGELSPRTFAGYYAVGKLVVGEFGPNRLVEDLRPEDFERLKIGFPRTWGPIRRGNTIQVVRSIFRYADDQDLVEKPVKFGKEFKKPSKKTIRIHRAKQGKRMFEADELQALLGKAGLQLKAMVLLAANCGYGNTDIATLPIASLDLDAGWVDFPRPKTGIARRCPLWPETVKALRAALARRPRPMDEAHAGLAFITKYGQPWVKAHAEEQDDGTIKVHSDDALTKEMRKLLLELDINGHRNFYAIRHTFETIGGDSRDQVAVDAIMGHAPDSNDMAAVYRENVNDARLQAVTEHVRRWLFGKKRDK